jgi:hypothetical protein
MKQQLTNQLSRLRLAIILPLFALAPALSIMTAAPVSADTANWTYVGQVDAHSASCSTLSLPSITVSAGDLVVSINSAKGTPAAGLPSDSQSNTYTAYTSGAYGVSTARSTSTAWTLASASGSLTVTETCVNSNGNERVVVFRPAAGTTVTADPGGQTIADWYGSSYVGADINSAASSNELVIGAVFGTNSTATLITPFTGGTPWCATFATNEAMASLNTYGGVGAGETQVTWNGTNSLGYQTTTAGSAAGTCWNFQNYVNGAWTNTTQPAVASILGFDAS